MSNQIFDFRQITDYETYKQYVGKKKIYLGKGVNGRVYKVFINKAMPIAVKIIDLPEKEEALKIQLNNLEKEAQLLKKIDHQNIVKVYFNFKYINEESNERFYYIGMEYIEKDLEKLLQEKKSLNEFEISILASQLQNALSYLEANKIAHRDLKPANILINSQGTYKICDFSEYKWQEQTLKTFQNTLAGTPNYLSPELMKFYQNYANELKKNKNASNQLVYDPYKSDVFSFGLVLIQCLIGCHEMIIGILNQNENDLQQILNTKCSEHLRWFLSQCMSFDSNQRLTFNEMNQIFKLNPIEISSKIFALNTEIAALRKQQNQPKVENQQLSQEIGQLKNQINKLNKEIASLQTQLDEATKKTQNSVSSIKKPQKQQKEIEQICMANQTIWKNWDNIKKIAQVKSNANLQWNIDNFGNYFDNYWIWNLGRIEFWNDQTGQNADNYWRFGSGEPKRIVEKDIPKAVQIVKKVSVETGYEFRYCLAMLHSNLWDINKSKNDLLN